MTVKALDVFEQERANLSSLTYRMLGVVEDAEDAVQETLAESVSIC